MGVQERSWQWVQDHGTQFKSSLNLWCRYHSFGVWNISFHNIIRYDIMDIMMQAEWFFNYDIVVIWYHINPYIIVLLMISQVFAVTLSISLASLIALFLYLQLSHFKTNYWLSMAIGACYGVVPLAFETKKQVLLYDSTTAFWCYNC